MADEPPVPELDTLRLRLRRLVPDGAPALHAAYGDAATMVFWDAPPSADLAETARRVRFSHEASPVWHAAWAVLRKNDGRFIGMVNYHARNLVHRRLAVGWIVVPAWQRRGIMREAMPALLDHCIHHLQAHRIEARIAPDNVASIRLAERLGFTPEGLMRDWLFVGDEPRSVQLYALLRTDWTDNGRLPRSR